MNTQSKIRSTRTRLAAGILLACAAAPAGAAWLNETDLAAEADYAVLQFPASINVPGGSSVGTIFGRIYEAGVTEDAGANALVSASLGYGPAGSDPRTDSSWQWFGAAFNLQAGNDDEYAGGFLAPVAAGSYSYTFRFSFDGGTDFTLADLDGAGANGGLSFNAANLGTLNVTAPPVPVPGGLLLAALPAALLAACRRRHGARSSGR